MARNSPPALDAVSGVAHPPVSGAFDVRDHGELSEGRQCPTLPEAVRQVRNAAVGRHQATGIRLVTCIVVQPVSVVFGCAHLDQGATGMIENILNGLMLAGLYLACGRNLAVPVIAHGLTDTLDFVLHKMDGGGYRHQQNAGCDVVDVAGAAGVTTGELVQVLEAFIKALDIHPVEIVSVKDKKGRLKGILGLVQVAEDALADAVRRLKTG